MSSQEVVKSIIFFIILTLGDLFGYKPSKIVVEYPSSTSSTTQVLIISTSSSSTLNSSTTETTTYEIKIGTSTIILTTSSEKNLYTDFLTSTETSSQKGREK